MTGRRAGRTTVGFAEVPDFHVEVARRASPELETRPLLIGGDPTKHGKLLAMSADLRALGLVEGMGLDEALDRVPTARWVATDMRRARDVSGSLRAAVRQEIAAVEIEGLAGFYLRAPREREAALELADRIQKRVLERTGLPLRVGIAPARFAARWAAEDAGRSGARVIADEDLESYLLHQPVERLPGVGPKTAARLAELGATDVPALRDLGLERLEVLLGNHGRALWLLACGEDPKPLRVKRHPETLSREETLSRDEMGESESTASLSRLAERLERGLRRDGLRARRIALRVTAAGGRTVTRSLSLDSPVASSAELLEASRGLLSRMEIEPVSIRRIGIVLKGLELGGAEDRQLDLF